MSSQKIIGVIPARYSSTRLPGKPLVMIGSKTMIERVYCRCLNSQLLDAVIIATDDEMIVEEVRRFGGTAILTAPEIATGTDRCFEAIKQSFPDAEIVVNIQGDEPLIDPSVIDTCINALLLDPEAVCSTPVARLSDPAELNSPNCVKAVFDKHGRALYFSRSTIPYIRNASAECIHYKHIGLYAYRHNFLKLFVSMEQTAMEKVESLEQLRILSNGYKIHCCPVEYDVIGVDTPEDLERVRQILCD